LTLALTAAATAQPGGAVGGPGGGGPIEQQTRWRLLTSAAVRADLKVSADQKAKLDAIPEALRGRYKAQTDALNDNARATAAARKNVPHELAKPTEEAAAAVPKPGQVARMKQLHLQALGHGAFELPQVQAALRLTEAQQAAIRKFGPELSDAAQKAQQEAARQAGGDTAKMQRLLEARWEELTREYTNRALLLLNADQRRAWEARPGAPGKLPRPEGAAAEPVLMNVRVLLLDDPVVGTSDHTSLLDHPGLAKGLGLAKEEADKLAAIPARLAQRFQGPAQKLQDEWVMLDVDRLTHEVQLGEEARGRAMKDVLTPEQAKRLTEIELQGKGLWAFGEPEVMTALKLTPEQSEAIEVAGDRVEHQVRDLPGMGADPKAWAAEAAKRVGPPMRDGLAAVLAELAHPPDEG